jgi:hypothetical protein
MVVHFSVVLKFSGHVYVMERSSLKGCLEFRKLFLKLTRFVYSRAMESIRITIKLLMKYLACIRS